ncbi:Mss4p nuclear export [Puccinia graminis f. sp. tritici]|uniref:Mss4p nuclear export n=1 Tax=Puccinia graminis f. sp. tritici TaxID=56615 RepID=A0A5B0RVC6_PUCGR|nr:Mss4p nuclear export [Puccinia graminis f. sp. tritici]
MAQSNNIKKRMFEGEEPVRDQAGAENKDQEKIEVTFEFCDLNPIDYHAIKHLISQLFRIARPKSSTNLAPTSNPTPPSKAALKPVLEDLDVGELADLVLSDQKEWVGCTVKCDEEDPDPYAFISVLDLKAYQDKKSILTLTNYLTSALASSNPSPAQADELLKVLKESLQPEGSGIGLVLSERLINVPVYIMPQLFTQLGNEIKHAQSKNAPGFNFDRLLIPSRVFTLSPNQDSSQDVNPTFDSNTSTNNNVQKPKKNKTDANLNPDDPDQVGLYHPEDQIISQFASHTVHFSLPKSKEARKGGVDEEFGVDQQGRLMLIELSKWDQMVAALKEYIGDPDQMCTS